VTRAEAVVTMASIGEKRLTGGRLTGFAAGVSAVQSEIRQPYTLVRTFFVLPALLGPVKQEQPGATLKP